MAPTGIKHTKLRVPAALHHGLLCRLYGARRVPAAGNGKDELLDKYFRLAEDRTKRTDWYDLTGVNWYGNKAQHARPAQVHMTATLVAPHRKR